VDPRHHTQGEKLTVFAWGHCGPSNTKYRGGQQKAGAHSFLTKVLLLVISMIIHLIAHQVVSFLLVLLFSTRKREIFN
jgi:hypothetical protein